MEAFAYDLQNGEKERLKGRGINPIGYFFGAMKQGGYNSLSEGFKTSEEHAIDEMLARLETRAKKKEEKNKKLEDLLFKEWVETKSKNELVALEKPVMDYMDSLHLASLKGYFLDNEMEEFKKSFN